MDGSTPLTRPENPFHAIAQALVAQANRSIAEARLADRRRPIGEVRLDIDHNHKSDRDRPIEDYDFHAHGHHYVGRGVRWAIWRVRWNGDDWVHVRKIAGPMLYEPALSRLVEECAKRSMKRVGEEG